MSAAAAKFAKQAKASAGKPKKKVTRFGGVKAGGSRYPRPQCGNYTFEYVTGGEGEGVNGKDPYFKAEFKVIESDNPDHKPGDIIHFDQCISAKAMAAAGPKLKAMAMAFLGLDEESYDALEIETCGEEGSFLEAVHGEANAFGENPLGGMQVYAQVTRGKDTNDGDWYRVFAFAAIDAE